MEELFKKSMDSDEILLWSSTPEKFEVLDKTYKPIFIKKLAISALIGVLLTVGYFLLASKSGTSLKWGIFVLIWGFCLISPAGIFRDANTLIKKVKYGITNKRFITIIDNNTTVEYDKIEKAVFYTDADGHTSLLCGEEAIKKANGNLRSLTTGAVSMNKDETKCESYAMYGVSHPEEIKKLLSEYITVEQI